MSDRQLSIRATAALATLALSTFAYVTAEALPIGLLTPIAEGLRTAPASVGLLVTGYGLVVVLASLPLTGLTRRLPRRRLLLVLMGVFVVGTVGSALAGSYPLLMLSRVLTALAQALFWSIVVPVGAGLVPERLRARAVATLYAGSSLAGVLGVPAGTWIGQQAGWRAAFLAVSAFGVLLFGLMTLLLPTEEASLTSVARGTAPDARRYRLLLATTALAVTGAFTAFTYVEPYVVQLSGVTRDGVSGVLLVRGIAGLAGVLVAGSLARRGSTVTLLTATGAQGVALLAQYAGAASAPVTVVSSALSAAALTMFAAALGARVLEVAPGPTDLASAGTSTAFNVGITGGALAGSALLSTAGLRSVALVGAAFTALAIVVQLVELRGGRTAPAAPVARQAVTASTP
jgi:MFS transporter, DHA1 family, inner membrane transport protein